VSHHEEKKKKRKERNLQDNQLARLAEGTDGEEEEANRKTRQGTKVAGSKDHQTIPPTHYHPRLVCHQQKNIQKVLSGAVLKHKTTLVVENKEYRLSASDHAAQTRRRKWWGVMAAHVLGSVRPTYIHRPFRASCGGRPICPGNEDGKT
jgi:hypothetical protein